MNTLKQPLFGHLTASRGIQQAGALPKPVPGAHVGLFELIWDFNTNVNKPSQWKLMASAITDADGWFELSVRAPGEEHPLPWKSPGVVAGRRTGCI